jgi:hypothetical protein
MMRQFLNAQLRRKETEEARQLLDPSKTWGTIRPIKVFYGVV